MASLRKRPGSDYWVCCYTMSNGVRTQRSTKQTDKKKAEQVCMEYEQAEGLARKGELTEDAARKIISGIVERVSGKSLSFFTVEEWLNQWLVDKKAVEKAEGTMARYSSTIQQFLKFLAHRAKSGLAHITAQDIEDFRGERLKMGRSNKTVTVDIKTLNAAFNTARRKGFIPVNPCEALDPLKIRSRKKETFTPEQIKELLGKAPQDWKTAILIGYYTGIRLQDVTNMAWDKVTLGTGDKRGYIRFVPQKTKNHKEEDEALIIPLNESLEDYLMSIAGDDPKALLCPSLAGRKTGGAHGLSMTFKNIMSKTTIKDGMTAPKSKGGYSHSKLSFHSLRHSFNSTLLNKKIPQEIRQRLTGHTSAEMNDVYSHPEFSTLQAAVDVMPKIKF